MTRGLSPSAHGVTSVCSVAAEAEAVEEGTRMLLAVTLTAMAQERSVPPLQLRALESIDRLGSLNVSQLASDLDLSVSSASRLVDRMVEGKLLSRTMAPHSRRETLLTLTAAGKRILNRVRRVRRQAIRAVLERMTADERLALVSAIQTFAAAAEPDA
jgi:DNA-binding MarR family transcriptional regulator